MDVFIAQFYIVYIVHFTLERKFILEMNRAVLIKKFTTGIFSISIVNLVRVFVQSDEYCIELHISN